MNNLGVCLSSRGPTILCYVLAATSDKEIEGKDGCVNSHLIFLSTSCPQSGVQIKLHLCFVLCLGNFQNIFRQGQLRIFFVCVYKTELAFCRIGLYINVKHRSSSIKNNHSEEGWFFFSPQNYEEKEREGKMFSKRRARRSPLFLFLVKISSSDSLLSASGYYCSTQ